MGFWDFLNEPAPNPFDFNQVSDAFEETASLGQEWTPTYNSGDPAVPEPSPYSGIGAVQQQGTPLNPDDPGFNLTSAVAAMYDKIGASHLDPNAGITSDQILMGWETQGIDPNNPSVRQAAQLAAQMDKEQQAQAIGEWGLAFQGDDKYAKPVGNYATALTNYGLEDVGFGGGATSHTGTTTGGTKDEILAGPNGQPVPPPKDKQFRYVNGVYYYRNGVIADPATGNVFFDPQGAKVPGSPVWMSNAQRTWSEQAVANWRSELYDLGYVDAKKGGWDASLIAATRSYYEAKYLNANIPVRAGKPGGATAATKPKPLDLHQLSASIQAQVQQQYQSVYGEDPTADELKSWTNFVINQGMSLQKTWIKQGRDAPDAALGEAEARFARRVTNSPEGKAFTQHQLENTALHDALSTAVSAVNNL